MEKPASVIEKEPWVLLPVKFVHPMCYLVFGFHNRFVFDTAVQFRWSYGIIMSLYDKTLNFIVTLVTPEAALT